MYNAMRNYQKSMRKVNNAIRNFRKVARQVHNYLRNYRNAIRKFQYEIDRANNSTIHL
jgi:Sec-independent protein translocase protein TatA